jgi:hypothetical protein
MKFGRSLDAVNGRNWPWRNFKEGSKKPGGLNWRFYISTATSWTGPSERSNFVLPRRAKSLLPAGNRGFLRWQFQTPTRLG